MPDAEGFKGGVEFAERAVSDPLAEAMGLTDPLAIAIYDTLPLSGLARLWESDKGIVDIATDAADAVRGHLAERGVYLVTEEMLTAAMRDDFDVRPGRFVAAVMARLEQQL